MINLTFKMITNPDYDGWYWYVGGGDVFDAYYYADAFALNEDDINPDSIQAVLDAATHLAPGEFLQVTHTESA
jgi:hypothetical protein